MQIQDSPPKPTAAIARDSRLSLWLSGGCLCATVAWLACRVWVGLDFGDEMQYYGEIASLARTGKFFQDDLFLQQLGYIFQLPFFKLHALVFPDQSYLILFGRSLLLAAYGVTGWIFWRAATKLGGFSRAQKLTGLAACMAWIPFQIFAFSYNSTAYLVIVALIAGWLVRDPAKFMHYAGTSAGLLTILTYTHPPAGLTFILLATAEAFWRIGRNAALVLLAAVAVCGLAVLGSMIALNGTGFLRDLFEAIAFSVAFGEGELIRTAPHFTGWLTLIVTGMIFVWHKLSSRKVEPPINGQVSPPAVRKFSAGLVSVVGATLGLIYFWKAGFIAVCVCLSLFMLLAVSRQRQNGSSGRLSRSTLLGLSGALMPLLAILCADVRFVTGYCATTLFVILLILLAETSGQSDAKLLAGLAAVGTAAGAVFAFTSGNGLHNFGMGAAGAIPFLTLYASRHISRATAAHQAPLYSALFIPLLILLGLTNGILHPYREQPIWREFQTSHGVPAFAGIRISREKNEAVRLLQTLATAPLPNEKRVTVIGPHPWAYFVLGGRPATPMFFMHFSGRLGAYEMVATRLFQNGPPDVIVLPEMGVPPAIVDQIANWAAVVHSTAILTAPPGFSARYEAQTGHPFSPHLFLLTRLAPAP